MDELSSSVEDLGDGGQVARPPTFRFSARDGVGLVSEDQLRGAASIVVIVSE